MKQDHKIAPRLLVVDDDPGVIGAYRLVLERTEDPRKVQELFGVAQLESQLFGTERQAVPDWHVTFVDQGADAVRAVQWAIDDGYPFAAIFLDVRMPPGIDGYEAAKQIRKIYPYVHIVVVTGYSDYTYRDFLAVAGPEGLLTHMAKPVWPDQLRAVARQLTAEKNHRLRLSA